MTPLAETRLKLLVIGCGNDFGGDDAVGLELVRTLSMAHDRVAGREFHTVERAGPELLDLFDRASSVLFVDAVVGAFDPGTVILTKLPSEAVLARHIGGVSTHGWGLGETLALARTMGRELPRLVLLGIEIAEAMPATAMSSPVRQAMVYVEQHFAELVERASRLHHWAIDDPQVIVTAAVEV